LSEPPIKVEMNTVETLLYPLIYANLQNDFDDGRRLADFEISMREVKDSS
jgi:hypothetical protein